MSYTFTIAPVTPETFSQAGGFMRTPGGTPTPGDLYAGIPVQPGLRRLPPKGAGCRESPVSSDGWGSLWEWSAFGRAGLTICMYCPGVRAGAMARRCCASPWPMGDGGSPSSPPTPEQLDSMRSMDFLRAAESGSGKSVGTDFGETL